MTRLPRIMPGQLKTFVVAALESTGMSPEDATLSADTLVTTDAMGVFTHGTKLLAQYLNKLQAGGYVPTARPTIDRQGPAWAVVDGQSALGMVGCHFALELALSKAKNCGVGFVGLKNTAHIGAIGYYAAEAARRGFIAMITGNDIPSVAAPGSRAAILGSNPIAYAVPVAGSDPIMLDMATAAVAGGKVYAAYQRGEQIPSTWLIGPDGLPTSDGSLYPDKAWLAPMAGHKGYGIGLWCEIMSAVLPGGNMTWEVGSWIWDPANKPSQHTASFTLIDVYAITEAGAFDPKLRKLINEIHAAPTAAGIAQVMLPGQREWQTLRYSHQHGIDLPADVHEKLSKASELTGIQLPWAGEGE